MVRVRARVRVSVRVGVEDRDQHLGAPRVVRRPPVAAG